MAETSNSDVTIIKNIILGLVSTFCAILFFAYKVDACKSTPDNCHDQFFPVDTQYSHECKPGATIEPVLQPKPGFFCHCSASHVDAGQ